MGKSLIVACAIGNDKVQCLFYASQSFPSIDRFVAGGWGGGDDFNFDGGAFREGSDLNGGAGGGVGFEVGAVKLVYGLEIGEVGQENGRLDDVSEIQSLCPEHGCDVFHYPPRLCINVAGNDFASLWIQRDLAGTKDEIANTNGLRVRPDCRGGLRGGDDFLHGAMLAAACAMSSDLSCRGRAWQKLQDLPMNP